MPSAADLAAPDQLPAGFVSVHDVLDGRKAAYDFINVIGVIIDNQAPRATNGQDWKTTIHIIDKSVDEDGCGESLAFHMFLPEADMKKMPHIRSGHILYLHRARVQERQGDFSLLSHKDQTKFSIFNSDRIPKPPADASVASASIPVGRQASPSKIDLMYISRLYHTINKNRLPSLEEYEAMVVQSAVVKEKYKNLADVREGMFVDLVAEITKEPYDMGDKMTFWVSDYTENPAFFNFTPTGASISGAQDGDPYAYVPKPAKKVVDQAEIEGPFGKRSMQITCWEPHVSSIREGHIKKGNWVSIKNLQIRYGRSGSNLEGFLREDRNSHGVRIGIQQVETRERESMSLRTVEGLTRQQKYEKEMKSQLKEIRQAGQAGLKRKSEGLVEEPPAKSNAAARRAAKRKAKKEREQQNPQVPANEPTGEEPATLEAYAQTDHQQQHAPGPQPASEPTTPDLNTAVKCENHNVPPSSVSTLLKRTTAEAEVLGKTVLVSLPYVNMNSRVDVRVTDFYPADLKGFTRPKKESKFVALVGNEISDESEGEDSDESEPGNTMTDFTTEREWEWRFWLELEDASPKASDRQRFWVVVSNQEGQCLTNLDATNLKLDSGNLNKLRECMFTLWGNLEEQKVAEKKGSKRTTKDDGPPPDSSDEEEGEKTSVGKITNRPFSCCVRQYGIKVREEDPGLADADKSHRWVRTFGLYGTRITGH